MSYIVGSISTIHPSLSFNLHPIHTIPGYLEWIETWVIELKSDYHSLHTGSIHLGLHTPNNYVNKARIVLSNKIKLALIETMLKLKFKRLVNLKQCTG